MNFHRRIPSKLEYSIFQYRHVYQKWQNILLKIHKYIENDYNNKNKFLDPILPPSAVRNRFRAAPTNFPLGTEIRLRCIFHYRFSPLPSVVSFPRRGIPSKTAPRVYTDSASPVLSPRNSIQTPSFQPRLALS